MSMTPISIGTVTWTDVGCEEEIIFSESDFPFICLQWNAVRASFPFL